jgi:hypothetical protein
VICHQCLALQESREERAGILEYDGGLPRQVAERRAAEIHPDRRTCGHDDIKRQNVAQSAQTV